MYISVNTSKVKDTKDKEPSVMDIQLINALGHFKLFKCRQEFLNNLDANYEHACMENVKDKYCMEMYNTITNYNDRNHKPLSNANIREVIDKLILEQQAELNNIMVDTFSPQRKKSENMIDKVANLTKNKSCYFYNKQ